VTGCAASLATSGLHQIQGIYREIRCFLALRGNVGGRFQRHFRGLQPISLFDENREILLSIRV
jgi:hypothetical protein